MRAALLLAFTLATALSFAEPYGYVFAGGGSDSEGGRGQSFVHFGGAGEARFAKLLGAGGEAGVVTARERGGAFGLFSGNASFHVPLRGIVDPFLTGGYGLATNFTSSYEMPNWGGGVNVWIRSNLGVRLEFRDFVWRNQDRHLYEFRAALTFK
jgi:hypothetical protein